MQVFYSNVMQVSQVESRLCVRWHTNNIKAVFENPFILINIVRYNISFL
jgi:hypothetical protein